ncbi:MAG: hypothetical protein AB1646_05680 [Thermodesulfobacteriota bacterium]
MCTASVAGLIFEHEEIQRLLANPILDMVHRQVVLTLYGLDADRRLDEYQSLLPVYLNMSPEECSAVMEKIEKAGLVVRSGNGLALTYPLNPDRMESSCRGH